MFTHHHDHLDLMAVKLSRAVLEYACPDCMFVSFGPRGLRHHFERQMTKNQTLLPPGLRKEGTEEPEVPSLESRRGRR